MGDVVNYIYEEMLYPSMILLAEKLPHILWVICAIIIPLIMLIAVPFVAPYIGAYFMWLVAAPLFVSALICTQDAFMFFDKNVKSFKEYKKEKERHSNRVGF